MYMILLRTAKLYIISSQIHIVMMKKRKKDVTQHKVVSDWKRVAHSKNEKINRVLNDSSIIKSKADNKYQQNELINTDRYEHLSIIGKYFKDQRQKAEIMKQNQKTEKKY